MQPSGNRLSRLFQVCAAAMIWLFVLQCALRLAILVPVGMGRLSPFVHGAGIILFIAIAWLALVAFSGRRIAQGMVALAIAAVWLGLTVFDVIALVTGRFQSKPVPLDSLTFLYCEGKNWIACMPLYPRIVLLAIAAWLAFGCLLLFFADEIAARLHRAGERIGRRFDWPVQKRFRQASLALALPYALVWTVSPSFMIAREPLAYLLQPLPFLEGPAELVNGERPDYRVQPTGGVRPRPLILISVDSLRADYVGLKPGQPTLTPFLRSLALSGKLQDLGPGTAICTFSYCGMIGLQSSSYWASQQGGPPLMLTDVLAANGYQSHYILSGPHRSVANLARIYGPNVTTLQDDASPDAEFPCDDRLAISRLANLRIGPPERTYIWFHLMSAHLTGLRFKDGRPVTSFMSIAKTPAYPKFYADGVSQADEVIRQIFEGLGQKGLLDDALVIITSDHGERIGVGGIHTHGLAPDEMTAFIPMLVYDGRSAAWPRRTLVSQMDIAPTLLDAVGIPSPAGWHGVSLLQGTDRAVLPADSYESTGMLALVNGRQVLFNCDIASGVTTARAIGGPPLTASEKTAALSQGPALFSSLLRRNDAGTCFARSGDR